MTGRSVDEWVGKTADSKIPARVRDRLFEAKGHRCHNCTRVIEPGQHWTLEHLIALINGGENRESNLGVTCDWCLPGKNAADVAEKSTVYRKRAKANGIKTTKYPPMPGTKASGWKRKMDGTLVRRK
jgi:5-methylcytosine-specific restriction protein A